MFNPVSTYRIQFHQGFTFKHLQTIIPYLHQLGIRTLYASPIFEAVPASTHGYDIVDPLKINPEIGTIAELRTISKQLRGLNISWLQDIVPNHMAFHPGNKWLMNVLENGRQSAYAPFFDIEWDNDIYHGRLMVPFLGLPFEAAVERREIRLAIKEKKLWLTYADQQYPVKLDSPLTAAKAEKINHDPKLLLELAAGQAYQLCHWQQTDKQINYRRFFTVNGLICLNMQRTEVFQAYHQLIKQLLNEGIFQGLRVDHVDGLKDPGGYLKSLRALAGPETYITVEKILEKGESFPAGWPVQGNTGYDFLSIVNNVFTQSSSEKLYTSYYQNLTGEKQTFEKSIWAKKAFILNQRMAGELENLSGLFKSLDLVTAQEWQSARDHLKEAIARVLIHCPVYRFYGNEMPLQSKEATAVSALISSAGMGKARLTKALNLLRGVLLERTQNGDTAYNTRALLFYQRCMQFTGPLMAKGVEDTLMYTNSRFIGHNEVGDSPASFGMDVRGFHHSMRERQLRWPLSINATSTHDTKRGEDVRARLNVLTDIPAEWFELLQQWRSSNAALKSANAPDENDEYFIYQTIIGAYPMPESGEQDFPARLQEYMIKALREGKNNSDWAAPNEPYESAVTNFIAALLGKKSDFRQSLERFHRRISDHGVISSLAQVLLKFTSPGVPDLYQGCELWDLSLVDPDNRRRVDFSLRSKYLPGDTAYDAEQWQQLWETRYNGQIKLWLTRRLLSLRSADPEAFSQGDYIPLTVTGKYKANVLAFARHFGRSWYITAIPLHLATIGVNGAEPLSFDWENTAIVLPQAAPRSWQNLLSTQKGYSPQTLSLAGLFIDLPVALIKLDYPPARSAGLLLHISSLPSAFGLGDIGPQAHRFVDFLFQSGQRYWQMLPVNPVDQGAGYSPYSATSGMAGNTMLISPEFLIDDGWLSQQDLPEEMLPLTNRAEFIKAAALKGQLFSRAYQRFLNSAGTEKQGFNRFKLTQAYWLNDFSLYRALKKANNNKPWYEWTNDLRARELPALDKAEKRYCREIDQEKWLQYIFCRQWRALKSYAEKKGVTLFGDMPFYISYDSADVWANPGLFKLDKKFRITGIAGVPPDYFSAQGQLWGMPVYNWDVLKQNNYRWWLQRIRKNLEYFDLIRLDHFRAFAAYWEVPGGEQTAINGTWMPGPGADFFDSLKKDLGHLPFVAEDLGEIDETVCQLRDAFGLPGMKVLQFGFGHDLPVADHIPHNYTTSSFAYTGTHDNNTLKGWYTHDIDQAGRKAIGQYTGRKVTGNNIGAEFERLCYASVSNVAVLPLQDVLKLDASHRMNIPSSAEGNWSWRITGRELTGALAKHLRELTLLYGR